MGIVTSNAWLDVNYGYELQKFFLKRFKIVAILESRCEPWFTEASVNTVVTIIERCDDPVERDNHLAKFVKVKKPLVELVPGDPVIDAVPRLVRLRNLVTHVEQAGRKYFKTHPLGIVTEEDDNFRIRILRQSEMATAFQGVTATVKWGQYLRSAEPIVQMFEEARYVSMGLSSLASFKRGSKTHLNDFYHVSRETASEFHIEPEFLHPLLKSPGDTIDYSYPPARSSASGFRLPGNRGRFT